MISEFEGDIMLLNADWKFAVNHNGEPYLLFDRYADPLESKNLSTDPETAVLCRDLEARLLERVLESQVQIR